MSSHRSDPASESERDRDRARAWFRLADELRGGDRHDPVSADAVATRMQQAGWPLGWEDLPRLSAMERGWEFGRPVHLTRFLSALGAQLPIESALDPFVTAPGVLGSLTAGGGAKRLVGFGPNTETIALAKRISGDAVQWHGASLRDASGLSGARFDWIVSSPPLGLPLRDGELPDGLDPRGAREAGLIPLARALGQVDRGVIVLLGEQFLWTEAGDRWRTYFRAHGFELSAAVSVVEGLAPATSLATVLCVFERAQHDRIFVARLTPATEVDTLAAALAARAESRVPELGSLVDPAEFKGWDSFVARLSLERALTRSRVPMETLDSLAVEFKSGKSQPGVDSEPATNSLYFDARVIRAVTTAPPVPREGARYDIPYNEVALDPERVDAEFVARWLNGDDGKLVIQSLAVGAAQKRVQRKSLGQIRVPVPPLKDQVQGLALSTRLSGLRQEVGILEARLWREPWTAPAIEDELSELVEQDPLLAWVYRLPFPLAAIAVRYMADADDEAKIRRLLHFFEAFAELAVITLLSALQRHPELWERERERLRDPGPTGRHPLSLGQFGGWIHLGFHLAKVFRGESNGNQTADDRRALFGVASADFIDGLAGKQLWATLDEARVIRNQRGHGGDWGQADTRRRLERLERLLGDLRDVTNRSFNRVELIQPGSSRRSQGSRRYERAKRLTGPLATFTESALDTQAKVDLDDDCLCFVDRTDVVEDALVLIPLIRLMPSPETEQNAAFFFNKQERGTFTFVSYAFQGETEAPFDDPELAALVSELLG